MLQIVEKPHQGPVRIWYAEDEADFTRRVFDFYNVDFQDITKEFLRNEWGWVEGDSYLTEWVFDMLEAGESLVFIHFQDREYTLPGGCYGFHVKSDLPSQYEIAKRINRHDLQSQSIETVDEEGDE